MIRNKNSKRIPRSVLIFGAAAHIGKPLAVFLRKNAPHIKLRLVSRDPNRNRELSSEFPTADIVCADYFDPASLQSAVKGMEGVFVIAPGGIDEAQAMANLTDALVGAGCVIQVLRCLGIQPEANPNRIPSSLRISPALNLPIQHPIAKRILDESGLPVTYLNFGATFMDNFFWMKNGLVQQRKLIWHNRLIPFIDPRDISEIAGRIFLSDNHRHIGQFHTLNNGQDLMRFSDVAELMSDVYGTKIAHDGSKESFFRAYVHLGDRAEKLWDFFEYEHANEVVWAKNDFAERILERKPVTLREWLIEHRDALLG